MKTTPLLKILVALAALFPLVLLAQNGSAVTPLVAQPLPPALPLLLIPILTPLIVRLGAWALPELPSWLLPILAPAIGALVDYMSSLALGTPGNLLLGALLGSAGTGLREVQDQVRRAIITRPNVPPNSPPTGGPNIVPLLLLFGALTLGLTGCKSPRLESGGVYAPTNTVGQVVYSDIGLALADSTYRFTYEAALAVFDFERKNRADLWALSPKIKHNLDDLRPRIVEINYRWALARAAYRANPTPAGLSTVQTILAELQRLLPSVQAQLEAVTLQPSTPK